MIQHTPAPLRITREPFRAIALKLPKSTHTAIPRKDWVKRSTCPGVCHAK